MNRRMEESLLYYNIGWVYRDNNGGWQSDEDIIEMGYYPLTDFIPMK